MTKYSLVFSQSNSRVLIPHDNRLNMSGPCTFEIWFKLTDGVYTNYQPMFDKTNFSSGNLQYFLYYDNRSGLNRLAFRLGSDSERVYDFTESILGKWIHVALVYTGSQISLYINGVLRKTVSAFPTFDNGTQNLALASRSGSTSNLFRGHLDEFRIWNYARTAQQIAENILTVDANSPGLIGYWRMDEGSGTTVIDSSGNGHDGTITNSTYSTDVPHVERSISLTLNQQISIESETILPLHQRTFKTGSIDLELEQIIFSIDETVLNLEQSIFLDSFVLLPLEQVIRVEDSIILSLVQKVYKENEIPLNLEQSIFLKDLINLDLKQKIHLIKSEFLNIWQQIFKRLLEDLNLEQKIYLESFQNLSLEQVIYKDLVALLPLIQVIGDGISIALNLVQEVWHESETLLELEQIFYNSEQINLSLIQIVSLMDEVLLDLEQRVYTTNQTILDLIIEIVDKTAIIGQIHLRGKIELFLSLRGGISMTYTDQNFSMIAGDTKHLVVTVDEVESFHNVSIKWGARKHYHSRDNLLFKTLSNGIKIEDEKILVKIDPMDTDLLNGSLYHEMELTDSKGNISTLLVGKMIIEESGVE